MYRCGLPDKVYSLSPLYIYLVFGHCHKKTWTTIQFQQSTAPINYLLTYAAKDLISSRAILLIHFRPQK
jgi:hypothetical protein